MYVQYAHNGLDHYRISKKLWKIRFSPEVNSMNINDLSMCNMCNVQ